MLKCTVCNNEIKGFTERDSVKLSEKILLTACPTCSAPMKYDRVKKEVVVVTKENFKEILIKTISEEDINPIEKVLLTSIIESLSASFKGETEEESAEANMKRTFKNLNDFATKEDMVETGFKEFLDFLEKQAEECDCPDCRPDLYETEEEECDCDCCHCCEECEDGIETDEFIEGLIETDYVIIFEKDGVRDICLAPCKEACEEFLNKLEDEGARIIRASRLEDIKVKTEIKQTLTIVE